MKVNCLHGFFIFEETSVGQVSDFMALTGLSLVQWRDAYTFHALATSPRYSIKGAPIHGIPALKTFEGEPWEVFEENELVYDFTSGQVVPITSVAVRTTVKPAGNRYISPGLILPGSLLPDGSRVQSFSGWYSRQTLRWLYSEVGLV